MKLNDHIVMYIDDDSFLIRVLDVTMDGSLKSGYVVNGGWYMVIDYYLMQAFCQAGENSDIRNTRNIENAIVEVIHVPYPMQHYDYGTVIAWADEVREVLS